MQEDFSQGTPQEWVDILKNYTTISDCKEWWQSVCKLTWEKIDALSLRSAYIYHVSRLAAKEWRERPIDEGLPKWVQECAVYAKSAKDKGNVFKNTDVTKTLINNAADEDWFKRNRERIPVS